MTADWIAGFCMAVSIFQHSTQLQAIAQIDSEEKAGIMSHEEADKLRREMRGSIAPGQRVTLTGIAGVPDQTLVCP